MTEFDNRRGSNKKGILRKFHYGLVSVSDGKSRPQSGRIKLCSDYITLQREEFHIWEDEDTYNVEAGLRTVSLARAEDGTLGISIKGGSEYNLPILISRVTSDCDKARWENYKFTYTPQRNKKGYSSKKLSYLETFLSETPLSRSMTPSSVTSPMIRR